jgi:hypothetical protein
LFTSLIAFAMESSSAAQKSPRKRLKLDGTPVLRTPSIPGADHFYNEGDFGNDVPEIGPEHPRYQDAARDTEFVRRNTNPQHPALWSSICGSIRYAKALRQVTDIEKYGFHGAPAGTRFPFKYFMMHMMDVIVGPGVENPLVSKESRQCSPHGGWKEYFLVSYRPRKYPRALRMSDEPWLLDLKKNCEAAALALPVGIYLIEIRPAPMQ